MEPSEASAEELYENARCRDKFCVCGGKGVLVWVVDYHRWSRQLLCNQGGVIFLEIFGDLEVYDYVGDNPALKGNPVRDAPPTPKPEDFFRCKRCGRLTLKTGRHHKYCPECAKERERERKRLWARKARRSGKIKTL